MPLINTCKVSAATVIAALFLLFSSPLHAENGSALSPSFVDGFISDLSLSLIGSTAFIEQVADPTADLHLLGENIIQVGQVGIGNLAFIDQSGRPGFIYVYQRGSLNVASINQVSNSAVYDSAAVLYQNGSGNEATLTQLGSGNRALARQIGDSNTVTIDQFGVGQLAISSQIGSDNQASIYQEGAFQVARLTQTGTGNTARIQQASNSSDFSSGHDDDNSDTHGNSSSFLQCPQHACDDDDGLFAGLSEYNDAEIVQDGFEQQAGIVQAGSYNSGVIGQYGSFNEAAVYQSGLDNMASVLQSGDNNIAGIFQSGNGNVADIAQLGSGNSAQINQYGDGRSIAVIQGDGESIVITQE